ncbi:MAG: sulfatase-like hydrolase/transferase, partial [Candidatus Eisenbacteria bacterium]|nr:sulfatase-like hydrolase/transferase [Candidatus Eisenbacteria bacterium]
CDATADLLLLAQEQGLLERTVVVILSDHGEEFWDHFPGFSRHGHSLYGEILDVPLMVFDPRWSPSGWQAIDQEVSLVDLVPTVADLLGLPLTMQVDGVSLVEGMRGSVIRRPVPILAIQRDARRDLRIRGCLIADGVKLIEPLLQPPLPFSRHYPCFNYPLSRELYDLRHDAGEHDDLSGGQTARADSLADHLRWALRAVHPSAPDEAAYAQPLSLELRRQLEAAGYVLEP